MHTFQTRSTAKRQTLTVLFAFLPMFALAFLGLKIAVATWLFFEIMLLLCLVFCLFIVKRTYWELEFADCVLLLRNHGNGQRYRFGDLRQADFVITQTGKQKEQNACDLRIQDAPFRMYDVQNCDELRTYIQKHFA